MWLATPSLPRGCALSRISLRATGADGNLGVLTMGAGGKRRKAGAHRYGVSGNGVKWRTIIYLSGYLRWLENSASVPPPNACAAICRTLLRGRPAGVSAAHAGGAMLIAKYEYQSGYEAAGGERA